MKDKRLLKRLLFYAKPYTLQFILVIVLMLITTGADLSKPIIIGKVVDLFGDNAKDIEETISLLMMYGALFLTVLTTSFVLVYSQTIILQKIGQKIIKRIRLDIYNKMLSLPSRYYHQNPVGALVTRVTNDTESLNEMYTSVITNLLKHGMFLTGILIMMFTVNVKISLYVVCSIPITIVMTVIFKYYSRKAYRATRNYLTSMNIFLSEHLMGMKLIQIFSREEKTLNKMTDINENLFRSGMKELYAFLVYRPSLFAVSNLTIALVLYIGSKEVLAGAITIGTIVIFTSYVKDFFGPIEQLAEVFNILQSAFSAAEKIFTVLDEENEIENGNIEINSDNFKGEIEFKNVWFAYKGEEWILKDVSFKINVGQKVAFVGATGAGKTSILSLISRYYDIQKGQILIDGIDIKEFTIESLRTQIGQVLQDVFMFTGDIEKNIRLGKEEISENDIKEAAKMVYANTFIEKMPHKYKQEVIEGGATLSTGERQLLSFARAIAYSPKIFILDEATANIDTETEAIIQQAIYKVMEGRTTIMVAHRLATIQHADNIIVLDKGKLMEMGTHQELLNKKGIYYNLYELSLNQ
ncbi:ABC transporter ATP-binding protein [Candidatus Epulonipiscium fishelsonii]|uniref:ABC transporter ATP-binding protein n=1 Tax=Candidatus Epulonipiscium fishelsonii TaxID=77094 RepID=A0ACC8X8Q2_9FIRM|nr:ABC transporter ATP-binding protein [Epulopiscium sp. SCG-B11WGA-EpuloA1]ONI38410.1 ABC transporter ATP-binding protein [Epulopiscium sp. SCG-B05WGA-EpuloA1]